MPSYETLCVLHPELPETRVKEIIAWMQRILEGEQSAILRIDEWGMRELAFRVKKQPRGYYVRLEYDTQPSALKEFERNLRLSDDVLRFLSVRRSAHAPEQKSVGAPTPAPPSSPQSAPPEADVESQ
jgi:small subunit ribosomal protein S6